MKSIAATVAARKRTHPTEYCQGDPRCLWRVQTRQGLSPCPRHPKAGVEPCGCSSIADGSTLRRVPGHFHLHACHFWRDA